MGSRAGGCVGDDTGATQSTLTIQLCWAEWRLGFTFASRFDPSRVEHAAAEGGLVEGGADYGLMGGLEVAQSEEVRQQREGDGRLVEFAAEPLVRCGDDGGVVECERLARFFDRA